MRWIRRLSILRNHSFAARDADCRRDRAAEHNAIASRRSRRSRLQVRVPAVDLSEHGFHLRIAEFIFRIPPIERPQRLIERVV